MAFASGLTDFHLPLAASAGASQWGAGDVRKLLDAAEASGDTTSITNHGTGGSVTRTVDPYTTSAADSTQADFGWAVTPLDLNAIANRYVLDASGNNLHGLVTGSPEIIASFVGGYSNALKCPGVDMGANTAGINFGTSNNFALRGQSVFCLDLLVKVDVLQAFKIIAARWGAAAASQDWTVYLGASNGTNMDFHFDWLDNADAQQGISGGFTTPAGGTAKVRVTYDGTTIKLYVDDMTTAKASSTLSRKSSAASINTFLGREYDAAPVPAACSFDEVRFSNVVRSDAMSAVYTPDANTLGLWHLNEISAKRVVAAGNHTINGRMRDNSGTGTTATLLMYVYRVAAGSGRARTLLGSNSASVSLPSLSAITDAVVTVNLAEVVLEPDETIQYGFEVTASGMVGTGRTITFLTGVSTTSVRVTHAGVFTRHFVSASTAMVAVATLGPKVIKKAFATAMIAVSAFARRLTLYRAFSTGMTGVATFSRRQTLYRSFATSMVGTSALWAQIKQDVLNRMSGGGTTVTRRKKVIVFDKV